MDAKRLETIVRAVVAQVLAGEEMGAAAEAAAKGSMQTKAPDAPRTSLVDALAVVAPITGDVHAVRAALRKRYPHGVAGMPAGTAALSKAINLAAGELATRGVALTRTRDHEGAAPTWRYTLTRVVAVQPAASAVRRGRGRPRTRPTRKRADADTVALIDLAVEKAGSPRALAAATGISGPAICNYRAGAYALPADRRRLLQAYVDGPGSVLANGAAGHVAAEVMQ